MDTLNMTIEALREVRLLRCDLSTYGDHKKTCDYVLQTTACTCGFWEALSTGERHEPEE